MSTETISVRPVVDCILVPVVRHDWTALCSLLRTMTRPCAHAGSMILVISLDAEWIAEEKACLLRIIGDSGVREAFSRVEFLSCNIPSHESVYIRDVRPKGGAANLKYGLKSGPNIQFFRSVNHVLQTMPFVRSLLLMETDLIPLVEFWVDRLNEELESSAGCLLAGARYQGGTILPKSMADHINGNAVLNLSHPDFAKFISAWEQLLIECMPLDPRNPYDVIIEWALVNKESFAGKPLFQMVEDMEKLYRPGKVYLEAIVNLGGPHESARDFGFSVDATLERFPRMILLHCRAGLPFADQLRDARCPGGRESARQAGDALGEASGFQRGAEQGSGLHVKTQAILLGINGGTQAISSFALVYAARILRDPEGFVRQIRSNRVLRQAFLMVLNGADALARKQLLGAMLLKNVLFDETALCGDRR